MKNVGDYLKDLIKPLYLLLVPHVAKKRGINEIG